MCQFSDKTVNLTFLAQISPKMNLGLEIQKSNIGIKISNFEILYVSIFSQIDNFDFLGPNSPPKKKIYVQSCENLSPDSESLLPRYHVCQFSVKTDKFDFLV